MKGILVGIVIAISFIVTVFTHHTDILSFLLKHDVTARIALPLAKRFHLNGYHHFIRNTSTQGSIRWLTSTTYLANSDAILAFELANHFDDLGRTVQQKLWLKKASELKHTEASLLRIKTLIKEQKLVLAKQLLDRDFLSEEAQAYNLLIELALLQGDKEAYFEAKKQLQALAPKSNILTELAKVSIFSDKLNPVEKCDISFFPVVTNLTSILRINQFIEQTKHSRFGQYVCFNPAKYLPLEQLHCQHDISNRIDCRVNVLNTQLQTGSSRYLLVMVPQGGANVNNGVLYLDQHDGIDVFYHELAHILGFVDEYPLPLNHAKCASEQTHFSHNVAVLNIKQLTALEKTQRRERILANVPWRDKILPSTPVYVETPDGIEIGTPANYQAAVGLFRTNTCNRQSVSKGLQAYKPISMRSKMEYFELDFPELYWQLFDEDKTRFLMPAFFTIDKFAAP